MAHTSVPGAGFRSVFRLERPGRSHGAQSRWTVSSGRLAPKATAAPARSATRSPRRPRRHDHVRHERPHITLTSGEIDIDKSLDIEGPGPNKLTISGNNKSRVFDIGPDATDVTIAGLTITDGLANGQSPNPFNSPPPPAKAAGS